MYAYIFILAVISLNSNGLCSTEDGRLPTNLKPVRYTLKLRPNIDKPTPPFPFNGTVVIDFLTVLPTDEIIINSAGLVFSNATEVGSKTNQSSIRVVNVTFKASLEWAIIKVSRRMEVNERLYLSIEFRGFLRPPGADGFWWDSYSYENTTKYMAVTQLEATSARYMFPLFDEVNMKAVFDVTVEHSPKHVALANTELVSSKIISNDWVADTFATTPIMTPYLVAVAVGEFVYVNVTAPLGYPVKLRIYATKKHIDCMQYAADRIFYKSLAFMEKTTGMPFQLNKLDIIAYPRMSGAMENWGLITFSEEFMCISPNLSSAVSKLTCSKVISHELAHQWYGNLVTNTWWDDMWLHEGFANNYNYYPLEAQGWEGRQLQQGDPERGVQQFFDADAKNTSDAIRKNVSTVAQAGGAASGSTYPKGGGILRMIRGIMGRAPMERAFTNYLTKYQYSDVNSTNLFQELTAQAAKENIRKPDGSPLNFETILDPWLNQMGFPIVNVSRSATNKSEIQIVRGDKFLNPSNQIQQVAGKYNYKWPIPITVLFQGGNFSDGQEILPVAWIDINNNNAKASVGNSGTGWYLINAMQNFFYRVNYDDNNYAQIAKQLATNHQAIPDESRSQIIDDAFTLSKNGYVTIDKIMPLTSYLNKETSYNPIQSIFKHANIISLIIQNETWYSTYQVYYKNLLEPQMDRLGWTFNDQETIQTQFLRTDVIYYSCLFLSQTCIEKAKNLYASYAVKPDVDSVDPNLLPTVLCVGAWTAGADAWQLISAQYLARTGSQHVDERNAYLFALSCTDDTALIEAYFQSVVGKNEYIAARDRNQAAQYLCNTKLGANLMWDYITNEWDTVNPNINKFQAISTITSSWKTEEQYLILTNFINSRNGLTSGQYSNLRLSALKVQQNIQWYGANAKLLQQWLANKTTTSRVPSAFQAARSMPTSAPYWRYLEATYAAMSEGY